eukprot:XP_001702121.1 flagellar associated protein, cobalamin adenosyltransferase-like protein [Chlamydomonas reinhardtii]
MKIYTRSGDAGQASLFNGERLYKDDDVFQALGDVDELNSALGVADYAAQFCAASWRSSLETIQSRLIDVGSAVATPLPTSDEDKLQRTHFAGKEHTEQLEAWIDAMDEDLPKLTKFILPSGGQAAACLHHARSVCRRAERSVVVLSRRQAVSSEVNMYVNRLSDYLFTAARHAAMTQGAVEKVYQKARS